MRQIMVTVATRQAAQKAAPWAVKIVKVDGGYIAFESIQDYATWRKQR